MNIVKRNGKEEFFRKEKIENAILKAMKYGSGIVREDIAKKISIDIEEHCLDTIAQRPTLEYVEGSVFSSLCEYGEHETAKAYEAYRAIQSFKRHTNTTDDGILGLVDRTDKEIMNENSNKNAVLISTQRDLIAGEVSKDIVRRKKLPARIVQAHDEGVLHFHDLDYAINPMFNCCLLNISDMLDNGTVISDKMIDPPNSFQVACTITTQIIAQVSSGQYGGQTVYVSHLGKYLRKSRDRYIKMLPELSKEGIDILVKKELESGVQTIQYQINTLLTTNGQSPFVTLFMNIEEGHEYEEEVVMIIEEILRQRILGVKNKSGVYIAPAFPKLIYVLDEHNSLNGGKYDYVTKLAVECSAKRMYPDYISAKRMRDNYEGNVFGAMGCRSFLSPWKDSDGKYKFEGRMNIGVVSLNLPQISILANGSEDAFWKLLDNRLELCYEALMYRHDSLKGVLSDVSPVHWQYGAIARLESGETIDRFLEGGYSTLSLGYIGVYEMVKHLKGVSHTNEDGCKFALKVMEKMRDTCARWKKDTGIGFALYGTPAESLGYRFAKIDKSKFGVIEDLTDKGYYTNSYHVDVRENIDAFSKLKFENQFQSISTGGCISYVEIPNMTHNLEALEYLVRFIYDNIQYAEFNTKLDYCHVCEYDGEIIVNNNVEWVCPNCGNMDTSKMNIIRRTCGYLGENLWNHGKTQEISERVMHL